MKKYKLKKDTLSTKAGAIFTRIDGSLGDIMVGPLGAGGDISIEVDDIINFEEWFEEVKEFQPFKCMTSGMVSVMRRCSGGIEEFYRSTGNCYPINTSDEAIIKEQKLIPQAMHRLKMAAKEAWFDFNGSQGPDWSDIEQGKYYIYFNYSYMTRTCSVVEASLAQTLGCVYFPTKESCQAHIDNNPEDLKLLFGVE